MFMISRFMFNAAYKDKNHLQIEPYEESCHINNFYYFRLGGEIQSGGMKPALTPIEIPPNSLIQVCSLESFQLSERVFAIFGSISTLLEEGVELINSPSIDPGFQGTLSVWLRNNRDKAVTIQPQHKIGKVLFFDCADTFMSLEEFLESEIKHKQLEERKRYSDEILRAVGKMCKVD